VNAQIHAHPTSKLGVTNPSCGNLSEIDQFQQLRAAIDLYRGVECLLPENAKKLKLPLWRSAMNLFRALCLESLVLLIVIAGCGGGSSVDPHNVTVSVSPSAVTIPANGQVTLQATVNGSPAAPALTWSIAELQTNGASGAQCNWSGTTPPAGPCPDGTIQGADANSQTVTYLAPSISGTFHVIAQDNVSLTVIKTATAAITVGP
jgi:hypothetical protein